MMNLWPSTLIPLILVPAAFRPASLIDGDVVVIVQIPSSANTDPIIFSVAIEQELAEGAVPQESTRASIAVEQAMGAVSHSVTMVQVEQETAMVQL